MSSLANSLDALTAFDLLPSNVLGPVKTGIYVVVGLHVFAFLFWVLSALAPKDEPYYVKKARQQKKEGLGDKNA